MAVQAYYFERLRCNYANFMDYFFMFVLEEKYKYLFIFFGNKRKNKRIMLSRGEGERKGMRFSPSLLSVIRKCFNQEAFFFGIKPLLRSAFLKKIIYKK